MYDIAIIAGGMATRLGKLTKSLPKSLIDINGKPFIYHQLKLLESNNFEHVVLCVGHFGNLIEEYVKTINLNLKIDFSYDGDKSLGTGGCIKNAFKYLDKNFFVLYGDSYLPIKYYQISNYYKSYLLMHPIMAVYKNKNLRHKNNIYKIGNEIIKYDKKNFIPQMQYIDYGVSILNKKTFEYMNKNSFGLDELYEILVDEGKMLAYEIEEKFYEIGSIEGIEEFKQYAKENLNVC